RVQYRRSDGRNTPGVDVPNPFDSGLTVTVPADGTVTSGFDIVRNVAKQEAPLSTLRTGETFISTIAEVTFYGHDQAGNEVSVTGSIGITFGNFADPQRYPVCSVCIPCAAASAGRRSISSRRH